MIFLAGTMFQNTREGGECGDGVVVYDDIDGVDLEMRFS